MMEMKDLCFIAPGGLYRSYTAPMRYEETI